MHIRVHTCTPFNFCFRELKQPSVIACSPLPQCWEPLSLWPTTPRAFTSSCNSSSYLLQIWENKATKRVAAQHTAYHTHQRAPPTSPIIVKGPPSLALLPLASGPYKACICLPQACWVSHFQGKNADSDLYTIPLLPFHLFASLENTTLSWSCLFSLNPLHPKYPHQCSSRLH